MNTLLDQVLKANIYIQPVILTVTVVTNILKISILCSRVLRTSPCTYYFIGYGICSIIYSCILCPTQVIRALLIGWENTLVGCKIYFYALFTVPCLARAMLVLASFDRYYSSSKSRRLNSTITKRTALITIIVTSIVVTIYMSPMPIIYYFDATTSLCRQYTSLPATIYVFSQMIVYYILGPLSLVIFGVLTIINTHRHALRTAPQHPLTHGRRTEGQLARMLLLQVCAHLILTTPFGIIYFLNSFNPSTRTPTIIAIRYILLFWTQCDYFISFFLYILSGTIYRQQLRHLFKLTEKPRSRKIHSIQHQQIATKQQLRTTCNTVGE